MVANQTITTSKDSFFSSTMEVRGKKKLCQRADLGVFEQEEFLAVLVEADFGLHLGRPAGELEDRARAETVMFNPLTHR